PLLDERVIRAYWPDMVVTKSVVGGESLSMHSYLVDRDRKRALLLHTASLFRNADDKQKRNKIGMANRLLHYRDMLFFKEQGCDIYDFGGYAKDTQDQDLININQFKEGFGGTIIEESHYTSIALALLRKASAIVKRQSRRKKPIVRHQRSL